MKGVKRPERAVSVVCDKLCCLLATIEMGLSAARHIQTHWSGFFDFGVGFPAALVYSGRVLVGVP